jgi:hypothetical protein
MTDEQHDPQSGDQLAIRSDPHLILEAIHTGIDALAVGYAIHKGTEGGGDTEPADPPSEASRPETPPMPGFNE